MSNLLRFISLATLVACQSTKIKLDDVNELPKRSLWSYQTNPDDSAAVFGVFGDSDELDLHLETTLQIFAADGCADFDSLGNLPPEEPGLDMGDVRIQSDGSVVSSPEFDALGGQYFGEVEDPVAGALDLTFSGSDLVDGATLPGLLVPVETPVITGELDGNNQLVLTDTVTYESTAEHVRFIFNFQEAGQNKTVACLAKNGSLDISALRPRLALGGSFFVEAANIQLAAVNTPAGAGAVIGQAIASTSVGYRNE